MLACASSARLLSLVSKMNESRDRRQVRRNLDVVQGAHPLEVDPLAELAWHSSQMPSRQQQLEVAVDLVRVLGAARRARLQGCRRLGLFDGLARIGDTVHRRAF